jgi:hypothetical protein
MISRRHTTNVISKEGTVECRLDASNPSVKGGPVKAYSNSFPSYKRNRVFTFGENLLRSMLMKNSKSFRRPFSSRIRESGEIGMENVNPPSLIDELTIGDDLMEYSDLEFIMFLVTNTEPLSTHLGANWSDE